MCFLVNKRILRPTYEQKSRGNVLIKNAYLHYNQFCFIILTKQQQFNINEQISKCKFTFKGAGERNACNGTSKNKTIKTVSNFRAKYLRISERIWCLRLHGKSNLSWPLTKTPLFLMFSNEIRFSKPFFYSNCYFCVTK